MFTKDNKVVQSYVLLIQEGEKTLEEVPDYQNLRKVVSDVLAQAD